MNIFIAYSRNDKNELTVLKRHLRIFERAQLIEEVWYDELIDAGQEWEYEINKNILKADLILLLVSSSFLDSDYCYEKEMRKALELHSKGVVTVIPIILKPCLWQISPLKKLQSLPKDGIPIISDFWKTEDHAFLSITQGIKDIIEKKSKENPSNSISVDEITESIDDEDNSNTYYKMEFIKEISKAEESFLNMQFENAREKYENALNYYIDGFIPNKDEIIKKIDFCKNSLINETYQKTVKTELGEIERDGDNGVFTLKLNIADMCLGTTVQVPTLDEIVRIKIPKGTQSGKIFRIKSKGFKSPFTNQRGDMLYVIEAFIPNKLSKEDEQILSKLKSSENFEPKGINNESDFFKKMREYFS